MGKRSIHRFGRFGRWFDREGAQGSSRQHGRRGSVQTSSYYHPPFITTRSALNQDLVPADLKTLLSSVDIRSALLSIQTTAPSTSASASSPGTSLSPSNLTASRPPVPQFTLPFSAGRFSSPTTDERARRRGDCYGQPCPTSVASAEGRKQQSRPCKRERREGKSSCRGEKICRRERTRIKGASDEGERDRVQEGAVSRGRW
jgi:hypothetical protein